MSENLFDLSGRVALVTGSSKGLGLAMAAGLAGAGATVVLNARNAMAVDEAVGRLKTEKLKVLGCSFDVTDSRQVNRSIRQIADELGAIDILVNNVGCHMRSPLAEMDDRTWLDVIDINLNSAFYVARAVVGGMIERRRGKIINICSLMSEVGRETTGNYAAAKGGLKMLTRAMTVEWAKYNIQINGIGPGYFLTEMTRPLLNDAQFDAWLKKRTPAGRWGQPKELVGPAVFLASQASDFVNGQLLYVDGGVLAAL